MSNCYKCPCTEGLLEAPKKPDEENEQYFQNADFTKTMSPNCLYADMARFWFTDYNARCSDKEAIWVVERLSNVFIYTLVHVKDSRNH